MNMLFQEAKWIWSGAEGPGLGIDIVEEELERHPYQPHNLRHFNGDLTMIRPEGAGGWYEAENNAGKKA